MNKCTEKIVDYLVQNGTVKDSERSIYEIGIRQLITYLLDIVGILFLGILFDLMWEAIVLSVLFMLIQRYAGSYHAPSRILCYVESLLVVLINLYLYRIVTIPGYIQACTVLFLFCIISLLAPVESGNKRLDADEKKIYKERARKICFGYGVLWCILFLLGGKDLSKIVLFVSVDVSIFQILGEVNLKFKKN